MDPAAAKTMGDWFDLCHRCEVGLGPATEMGDELFRAYTEVHRRYHTLSHIGACLRLMEDVPLGPLDRIDAQMAIWFHDVVYDPTRSDNEERSAELAGSWLTANARADAPRIEALIKMTARHQVETSANLVTQVVHDVDLAILGAPDAEYDTYAADIRFEYGHVRDDVFAAGRAEVLRHLMAADPLFVTPAFRLLFGEAAQANLARELAALVGS